MDREMKIQLFSIISTILAFGASSAMATTFQQNTGTPFSQYGQIQNVQNYSSNPFWDPSSPYNQRMPVPVYIQGTDVSSSDCQTVVSALIASYCSTRNNCYDTDVDEARPTLTVQLASLPNHNYVTPCAGYIDTEFDKYVSQNALAAPTGKVVAFPSATTPNADVNKQDAEFQNPYQRQLPTWNGDPWMQDMLERKQELENLQSATGSTSDTKLAAADFPTTAADLTFSQRLQNDAAGYAPYAGKSAYKTIEIESEEAYMQRTNSYCTQEITKLSTLDADIATLQNCRAKGTPFNDCRKLLKGTY